jgi:lipoprotein-releasing system permease protein
MVSFASLLWDALTRASGGAALLFIVAMALAIAAMVEFFLASSVIALDGFARRARRPLTLGVAWALWSLALVSFVLASGGREAFELGSEAQLVAATLGIGAGAVALGMALCFALLRWVPARRLGLACAGAFALGLLGVGLDPGSTGAAARVIGLSALLALAGAAGIRRFAAWSGRRRGTSLPRLVAFVGLAALLLGATLGLWYLADRAVASLAAAEWLAQHAASAPLVGGGLLGGLGLVVVVGLVPLAAAGLVDCYGSVDWFIAVRYLVAKRRQTFISIITGICVAGIAAGVWLIIVVLSVMNGFERTWREEIIGNRAHFTVQSGAGPFPDYERVRETLSRTPEVMAASPYLDAEGMVRGAGGITGVRVRGVDPARVGDVTDLREDIVAGSLEALADDSGEDPGIVIGSQLAVNMGIAVGNTLLLISPFGGPQTPLGPAPRLTRFKVVGIFETSFFQYDEVFTYVNLAAAQDFRRVGDVVDGIEVRTADPYRSQQIAARAEQQIKAEFGPFFYTRDWKEFFPAFFQALKSERVMMFVLLAMIMVVAAFAIVSTLVMMIMEKSSDIAILKAMGATDDTVERIFAIEGTLIGLAGTAIGVVASICVTANIEWIQTQVERLTGIDTLPASVYQISTLPAELDLVQIAVAVVLAMVLSLGATLLPSRQGARLDPVEALRYE